LIEADPVFSELVAVYEAARDRLEGIRATWVAEGCLLIGVGSTGQPVEHPLHKVLRDTELEVARLGQLVMAKRPPGRPMGANSAPHAGQSGRGSGVFDFPLAPSQRRRRAKRDA
jgi:hypothetical protein